MNWIRMHWIVNTTGNNIITGERRACQNWIWRLLFCFKPVLQHRSGWGFDQNNHQVSVLNLSGCHPNQFITSVVGPFFEIYFYINLKGPNKYFNLKPFLASLCASLLIYWKKARWNIYPNLFSECSLFNKVGNHYVI